MLSSLKTLLFPHLFILTTIFTTTIYADLTLTPLTSDQTQIADHAASASSSTTALTTVLLNLQTDFLHLNNDIKSFLDSCSASPALSDSQCADLLTYSHTSFLPASKQMLDALLAKKSVLHRYYQEICNEMYKVYDRFGALTDCVGGYGEYPGVCNGDVVPWALNEGTVMDTFGAWFGDFDCNYLLK